MTGSLLSDIELISMQDTSCNNIPLKSLIVRSVFIISTNVNTVTLSFYQTSQCLSVQFITPNTTFCVLLLITNKFVLGSFLFKPKSKSEPIVNSADLVDIYLSSFLLRRLSQGLLLLKAGVFVRQ